MVSENMLTWKYGNRVEAWEKISSRMNIKTSNEGEVEGRSLCERSRPIWHYNDSCVIRKNEANMNLRK